MYLCPVCKKEVYTNGIGPSNSPKFSWFLRTVFRFSCKLFRPAGDAHDLRYHMFEFGKEKADEMFLNDMLEIISESKKNRYSKKWFRKMAHMFHEAVVLGGNDSYDESQIKCLKALNLNSRSIN